MATGGGIRSRLLKTIFAVQLVSCVIAGALIDEVPAPQAALEPFSFDDIFDPAYRARSFSGQWIDGANAFLYRDSFSGAVMKFNAIDKTQTVYIDNTTFNQLQTGTYFTSPDLQYVLFAYERVSVWRHSFLAKYKILEVSTKILSDFPNGALADTVLQYAGWSSSNNALTFVTGNNLYYQANPSANPVQVTNNGDPTYIYNGVPDWLYEEDVISDRVSHYWSPNGRYICYAELNDTEVPLQAWPWYGSKDNVFGSTILIPYPKAGDVRNGAAGPTTKVKMYIYDTTTSQKNVVPTVNSLVNKDHYYLQVAWQDDSRVVITWANRVQNESWTAIYDVTQSTLTPLENYHLVVTGGWVEVPPATPFFIDSGTKYLTVLPQLVSVASGAWRHLALVTAPTDRAGDVTFLSSGEAEVDYIIGYDAANQAVYYIGTGGDPSERHLFQVIIGGTAPVCLTCDGPASCRYVTASFSSSYLYYILGCRGPEIPVYTLRERLNENSIYVLENNDALRASLATKAMPTREFINVPVNGGFTGRAEMFYPPGHVPGNKYPLLVFAYAGPGSQRVMKTFPVGGSTNNWLMYLKSTHKIAVASLDARGSMAGGDKLKFEMYRKLSVIEIQDQITGGEYFKTMDHIDSSIPLGIFGWSYGGGVAANVMGDPSKTFTCGISVAPVTTKAYYDTAYTERYLGLATPDDNKAGYDATDVMNKVQNFHNKSFLIAHGTADDNVHFMHATQLIRALSDEGIQFRQHLYMDQNHNINSPGQSRHLYATLTNFLLNDCWSPTVSTSGALTTHRMTMSTVLVLYVSIVVSLRRYINC